jgi:hypothetical protein
MSFYNVQYQILQKNIYIAQDFAQHSHWLKKNVISKGGTIFLFFEAYL